MTKRGTGRRKTRKGARKAQETGGGTPTAPRSPQDHGPDWTLQYSEKEVPARAGEVFWVAVAIAPWAGHAVIDFDNLSCTVTTAVPGAASSHSISYVCMPLSARRTLLQIHAHRIAPAEEYSLRSDKEIERKQITLVSRALAWSASRWSRLRIDAGEIAADLTGLAIDVPLSGAQVTVNGVVLEPTGASHRAEVGAGAHVVEVSKPGHQTHRTGVYCSAVQEIPSLFAFATTCAGAAPQAPAAPRGMPKPPPVPAAAALVVAPGVGRWVVGVLGRAAPAVAVALAGTEVARRVWVDIRIITDIPPIIRDNDEFERSCCCRFQRQDEFYGPPMPTEKPRMWMQNYEVFRRRFFRTVVRATKNAPCVCGPSPMFMPATAITEWVNPGQPITLPAGLPTHALQVSPGVRCPIEGQRPPTTLGYGVRNIRPPDKPGP